MEVYCKFKSAKDYDSIPIDWHYTTVSDVKDYLLKKKCSGKRNRTHYDMLTLINADTNEEYLDGEALIPKSTFLIVRRSPRCICMPIVINPPVTPEIQVEKEYNPFDEPSTSLFPPESEWVEFWNDLSPLEDAPPSTSKVGADGGFGRGGFGRGGLSDQITPPLGYVCHRCKVPGHFIQYCPTNGDPAFNNIKRTRRPSGIPNSMLMATSDGSYALPNGGVAVLKPDEATFEKEIQGIPSTRSVVSLPTELYCPLCKAVMKDAVLASKCCFDSFCDKCIREHIMSKSLCTCGATNVLADDLLPNKTLRDTILRMTMSINRSAANGGSAPCPQAKVPSPTGVLVAPKSEGNTEVEEMTEAVEVDNVSQETMGKVIAGQGEEVAEAVHECVREPVSQMYPPVTNEEMQQKISENVEKNKKKLADMPVESSDYNPSCNPMPSKLDGFGQPYCGQMPFIGYGRGATTNSFGASFNHNLFGAQVYMMSVPPQRGLANFGTGFNGVCGGFPILSTGENDTWKTTTKHEKSGGSMKVSRDRKFNRDMIRNEEFTSLKPYFDPSPELIRTSSKRKVKHDDDDYKEECKKRKLVSSSPAVNGWSHHRSYSMTSNGHHKDHKDQYRTAAAVSKSSYSYAYADGDIYELSDDDRHLRRRPSRYESSPAPKVVKGRHYSRGWMEKGVTAARDLSVH